MAQVVDGVTTFYTTVNNKNFSRRIQKKQHALLFSFVCFKMRNMKFNGGKIMGMIGYFAEIDSEKINQLLDLLKNL